MKRPAFQFYPADWRNNAKLSRCSAAAKGAWIDLLCFLHDMDEYGVCRWPLKDLAKAANVKLSHAKELAEKGVLKGSDSDADDFTFTPYHAGKHGKTVTILTHDNGPLWYCSRMVLDEYRRQRRGKNTQFSEDNQPSKKETPKSTPKPQPKGGIGERQGDGPTSTSTSTSKTNTPYTDISKFSIATVDNAKSICGQLRLFQLKSLDPKNPRLLRLIEEGANIQTFLDAVIDVPINKPLNYLLAKVERTWWQRSDKAILETAERLGVETIGLKRSEIVAKIQNKMEIDSQHEGKP